MGHPNLHKGFHAEGAKEDAKDAEASWARGRTHAGTSR